MMRKLICACVCALGLSALAVSTVSAAPAVGFHAPVVLADADLWSTVTTLVVAAAAAAATFFIAAIALPMAIKLYKIVKRALFGA